jgi:septum formation protein
MMRHSVLDLDLILASASPRRKYLLEEAGFQVSVIPSQIDESYPPTLPLEEIPVFLAEQKAAAIVRHATPEQVVIAADTIVVLDNQVVGKPVDRQDATIMLQKLSGRKHLVYTGVCLQKKEMKVCFTGKSEVFFSVLSDAEITYYIDHYQPFDKAGSYGIQEWIGWCKIAGISGSYSNIMGLPLEMVYEKLAAFVFSRDSN